MCRENTENAESDRRCCESLKSKLKLKCTLWFYGDDKVARVFDGPFGMGCSPSILSSLSKNNNNRKDSGLYCSNGSDTNSNNKLNIHNDSNTSTALANQILVQSTAGKDAMEKVKQQLCDHISLNCYQRRPTTTLSLLQLPLKLLLSFRRLCLFRTL